MFISFSCLSLCLGGVSKDRREGGGTGVECEGGLGQLGLLVSMVFSLCAFVVSGGADNSVEELKVRTEGFSWFRAVDKETTL